MTKTRNGGQYRTRRCGSRAARSNIDMSEKSVGLLIRWSRLHQSQYSPRLHSSEVVLSSEHPLQTPESVHWNMYTHISRSSTCSLSHTFFLLCCAVLCCAKRKTQKQSKCNLQVVHPGRHHDSLHISHRSRLSSGLFGRGGGGEKGGNEVVGLSRRSSS